MDRKTISATGSTRGTAYTMSNKVITHEGTTHVAWLDQIHKTYVRTYRHETRRWTRPVFVGDGDDNHGGAAFAMDSSGHLHLVYGPHHNPIQHAVSAKPNDSRQWIQQPALGGTCATYPSLVCDSDDALHVCYRGAVERERPWGVMYQRRPGDGAWSEPVKLVDPQGPPVYTHFANALHLAGDGTLFLVFHIVRATDADHRDLRGRGFGVMRSRDGGASWESMAGQGLDLPATPDSACVIEFDDGLDVRVGNLCSWRSTPFFTVNRREGEVGQTYLYRWGRDGWDVTPLLPEAEKLYGACMMSDSCALSISDDGVLYAAAVVCDPGGNWWHHTNEIVLFTSRDVGETFAGYRISPEDPSSSSWLPSLERHTGRNKVDVPHLVYTHGEAGEGCSPDVNTEIRFVSLDQIARAEGAAVDEAVMGAETLSGVAFTGPQREEIRRQVETNQRHYRHLREVDLGYDVEPPTVFMPGTTTPEKGVSRPLQLSPADPVSRPDSDEALAFLPVTALAQLVASRQVSPVELAQLYLDRLATFGEKLHCVVTLTRDLAMEQARAAEAEIAEGHYRGPLHGIPWGAKDLLATCGIPTTWGATPYKGQVIDADATVVERLREAGAVLVAKLSMGALARAPPGLAG